MVIKIYLMKKNGKSSRFPEFEIGFENDVEAQKTFDKLHYNLTTGNVDYIKCKAAIFKKSEFDRAVIC